MRPIGSAALTSITVCTLIFQQANCPALAGDDIEAITAATEKALTGPITVTDWRKLIAQADAAYKVEHYQESMKLYTQADAQISRLKDTSLDESSEAFFIFSMMANYAKLANYGRAKTLYAEFLKQVATQSESAEWTIKALNGLAEIETIQGLYLDAQSHLNQAIEIAKKHNLLTTETVASRVLLANMSWAQTRIEQSEKLYSDALSAANELGAAGKSAKADALDGLANVNLAKNNVEKSREQADQSFALRKELFSEESLEVASSMRTLARIVSRNNPDQAQQLQLKALAIQLKLLGTSTHPTVADTLLSLATATAGKSYSDAEHLCLAARHAIVGVLPSDSPFMATYLKMLAGIYLNEGRLKPARDTFQQALDLGQKLYGTRNMDVAECLRGLALTLESDTIEKYNALKKTTKVRCTEAEAAIQKAMEIADEQLGPDNAHSAFYGAALSWIKLQEGDYKDSESCGSNALKTLKKAYGKDSPSVRYVQNTLLHDYLEEGNLKGAKAMLAIMLDSHIKQSGIVDKDVYKLFRQLAEVEQLERKQLDPSNKKADSMPSRATRILQAMPAEASGVPQRIDLMRMQALGDDTKTGPQTALMAINNESIDRIAREYGDESPRLTLKLLKQADLYELLHNDVEADKFYRKALVIEENGMGSNHPNLINILTPYAKLLRKMGKNSEADAQTARCAAIRDAQ